MIGRQLGVSRLRGRCRSSGTLVLTYDDGPGPTTTPLLLDLLAEYDARATFFVMGSRAQVAPGVVDEVAVRGHEIGCHTFEHLHAWKSRSGRSVADICHGYESLARWIPGDAIYRPPYGKMTPATWCEIKRRRARVGWWTIQSGDTWRSLPTPFSVIERVRTHGGGVVLMHDFDREMSDRHERRAFVLETSDRLLAMAQENGLRVETLGTLLKAIDVH